MSREHLAAAVVGLLLGASGALIACSSSGAPAPDPTAVGADDAGSSDARPKSAHLTADGAMQVMLPDGAWADPSPGSPGGTSGPCPPDCAGGLPMKQ